MNDHALPMIEKQCGGKQRVWVAREESIADEFAEPAMPDSRFNAMQHTTPVFAQPHPGYQQGRPLYR